MNKEPESQIVAIACGATRMEENLVLDVRTVGVLTESERKRQVFCDYLNPNIRWLAEMILLPSNEECSRRWKAGEIIDHTAKP